MSAAVQVDTEKLCAMIRKCTVMPKLPVHTCPLCKSVCAINQKARHRRSKKCRLAAIPIEVAALQAKITELCAEQQKLLGGK